MVASGGDGQGAGPWAAGPAGAGPAPVDAPDEPGALGGAGGLDGGRWAAGAAGVAGVGAGGEPVDERAAAALAVLRASAARGPGGRRLDLGGWWAVVAGSAPSWRRAWPAVAITAVVAVALAVAVATGWRPVADAAGPVVLPPTRPGTTASPGAGGTPPAGRRGDQPAGSVPSAPASTAVGAAVHAAGAVNQPGVVRVTAGARVADVIAAAGGAAPGADLDRVNLAAPVADGERVYVPRRGEAEPPVVSGGVAPGGSPAGAGGRGAPTTVAGPVHLSTATAEQLDALPGVGPATAAAIIAWRDAHGGFRSVDELAEVKGIGPARLEQLRPLVAP